VKEITTNKNILTENSDVLQKYFKDISKYPIYKSEEQIELARQMKNGDLKARDKLIKSNLRFVVTCAKQFVGQGVPLIDLINSGNLGLMQSIKTYDPNKGYHFISYAVWYIRREIIKSIYNTGRTIRYPISYITNVTKVKKAYDHFISKYHREPTDEELINLANITQKQYESVILNKSYCQSIDTPITDDGKTTVEDILTEDIKSFSDNFTKDAIQDALKVLNPREYKVITEYYGLADNYERPIKEIAKEMNLGDERVRQLRKEAVKKLSKRCGKTLKTLL
jgi:RNA polymerase primary sigma factor